MSNQLERTQAVIAAMEDRDLEDNEFHVLAHHARELATKLDAVIATLEPGETPKRTFFDFHETYMQDHRRWKLKNELHASAVAIVEGPDNG